MFDRVIANIERKSRLESSSVFVDQEIRLATTILFLKIVPIDYKILQVEWSAVKKCLIELFDLSAPSCQKLLARAFAELAKEPSIFASAHMLKQNTSIAFRIAVLEAAKQIAMCDGDHHSNEIELETRLINLLGLTKN